MPQPRAAETSHEIYLRESLSVFSKIIARKGDEIVIQKYMKSLKEFGESIDKQEITALVNKVAREAVEEERRNVRIAEKIKND